MRGPTVFVYACGPSKPLDGQANLIFCGEELYMLVRLTRSAAIAAFQERLSGLDIRRTAGRGGTPISMAEDRLRTIVERKDMLPRFSRGAQQQIRLDEITRTQWRRLALEFYGVSKESTLLSPRAYTEQPKTHLW